MKATKGNKAYTITEKEKKRYTDAGYDIMDDTGKIIAYGRGKTVPYEQYEELKAENETLKASSEHKDDAVVIEILSAYAKEHGIDLGNTKTVAGIIKKIRGSNAEAGE